MVAAPSYNLCGIRINLPLRPGDRLKVRGETVALQGEPKTGRLPIG
jgi:hypothetical protein